LQPIRSAGEARPRATTALPPATPPPPHGDARGRKRKRSGDGGVPPNKVFGAVISGSAAATCVPSIARFSNAIFLNRVLCCIIHWNRIFDAIYCLCVALFFQLFGVLHPETQHLLQHYWGCTPLPRPVGCWVNRLQTKSPTKQYIVNPLEISPTKQLYSVLYLAPIVLWIKTIKLFVTHIHCLVLLFSQLCSYRLTDQFSP